MRTDRRLVALFLLAAVTACTQSGNGANADEEPSAAPPSAGVESPGDSLPAALLGTAPPPRGMTVNYYAADPAAAGDSVLVARLRQSS